MQETIEEERKAETNEKGRKKFVVSIQFSSFISLASFKFIIS